MNEYGKHARHKTLHLAFQALHSFVKKEGRLPRTRSQVSEGSTMFNEVKIIFPLKSIKFHTLIDIKVLNMPDILSSRPMNFLFLLEISEDVKKHLSLQC